MGKPHPKIYYDIIICCLGVIALYNALNTESTQQRRPPAYTEQQASIPDGNKPYLQMPETPAEKPKEPPVHILTEEDGKPKLNSTGTAFAIDQKGHWVTARHVVEKCKRLYVGVKPATTRNYKQLRIHNKRDVPIVEVAVQHKETQADLAILTSKERLTGYLLTADQFNMIDHPYGYAMGFPAGEPGEMVGLYLGRNEAVMKLGNDSFTQNMLVWSITQRHPKELTMGGISGGPVMNALGQVVGVNTGGNERRGRLYTSTPESFNALSDTYRAATAKGFFNPAEPLSADNYTATADSLRKQYTVAQVFCINS
jgi:serine protease Do